MSSDGESSDDDMGRISRRRKDRRRQEEVLFGVFADSDDSGDDARQKARGGKRADLSAPVSFVSSGVTAGSSSAAARPSTHSDGAESRVDDDGEDSGGSHDDGERMDVDMGARARVPARAPEVLLRPEDAFAGLGARPALGGDGATQAEFERYTKGFGSKMLAKMGFAGRLGKKESGIAEPIEVKQRPTRMGLSYNGFTEKTYQARRRESEFAPAGTSAEHDAPAGSTASHSKGSKQRLQATRGEGWKRSAPREKKKYRTAEELLQDRHDAAGGAAAAAKRETVIDMRGPQMRVVDGVSTALSARSSEPAAELVRSRARPCPELQHNVNLLADMAELDVLNADRHLQRVRAESADRATSRTELERQFDDEAVRLERMEKLVQRAERLSTVKGLGKILQTFRALHDAFPDEYTAYEFHRALIPLILPLLRQRFAAWQPFSGDTAPLGALQSARELVPPRIFEALAHETLAIRVQRAIANEWDPRDCDAAVALLASCEGVLGDLDAAAVVHAGILPRLARTVNEWDPQTDPVPIHTWIHPWLTRVSPESLDAVAAPVRAKFAAALAAWHPLDPSALAIIAPWARAMLPGAFDRFIATHIEPKLAACIAAMPIDPAAQDTAPFLAVVAWADVAGASVVRVLEREFFPRWLSVASRWTRAGASYDEIVAWYNGWRDLIPVSIVDEESVRQHLARGLDIINRSLAQPHGESPGSPPPLPPEDDFPPSSRRNQSGSGPYALDHDSQGDESLNIKEIIEHFASQNNVTFLPKPGKSHEGKPVYAFGRVSISFDRERVYALDRGSWRSVTLSDVLQLHSERA